MGVSDWAKVIFSDETKISRVGLAGRAFNWINKDKTALEVGCTAETTAFGAGGTMR